MRDLQQIFEECLAEVKSLKIPVGDIEGIEWFSMEDAWGKCRREWKNDHLYMI